MGTGPADVGCRRGGLRKGYGPSSARTTAEALYDCSNAESDLATAVPRSGLMRSSNVILGSKRK